MRIILFLLFLSNSLLSQSDAAIEKMALYSDIMVNVQHVKHRQMAQDSLYNIFKNWAQQGNTFGQTLDSVEWISVKYPEDHSFRVISWQCEMLNKNYTYQTFIQTADSQLFEFANNTELSDDLTFETLDPEYNMTQLVYNIYQYAGQDGVNKYMLFGYKQLGEYDKLKTLDVLSFDKEGTPIFETPAFVENPEAPRPLKKNRLLLKYSSDALVTITYNPDLGMMVHDHLIKRGGRLPGQGDTNLPDGSYVGYAYKDGEWNYVEKIYNQVLDEAPRPRPVSKRSDLKISGQKKRAKKKRVK